MVIFATMKGYIKRYCCLFVIIAFGLLSACQTNDTNNRSGIAQNADKKNGSAVEDELTNPQDMIENISQQIEQDTANAELYFKRSNLYMEEKDLNNAADDILKAMELDPENGKYYQIASEMLLDVNDAESAIRMLNRGLKAKPFDAPMRLQLAKYLFILEKHVEALKNIGIVIANEPTNPQAHFLKALIYKEKGNKKQAIQDLEKAVFYNPDYYDAYMQLGLLYSEQKDDLAVKYFDNAIRINQESSEALYAKGFHYQQQKNYAEAKGIYKTMLKKNPQQQNPLYNTGWILFQQDSIELAKKHFAMAVRVAPTFANAYHMRGLCSEVLGEPDAAIRDYEQALVFDEKHQNAKEALKRVKR